MRITELHFAIDLPYWFGDIKVLPEVHLNHTRYRSSRYFDSRRKHFGDNVNGRDNIIIYDKTLKCKLSHSITRIEQRLSSQHLQDLKEENQCIITDELTQQKLSKKINRKFSDMIVKKGRAKLDLITICSTVTAITIAMEYIKGDDSLLESLLSHRTPEVLESSKLFSRFIAECGKQKVYQQKPQLSPKMKPYLKSLSVREKMMLTKTVASYKYNNKWYKILREPKKKIRLNQQDKDEALFLYELGNTQAEIAKELGVSESSISRLFSREGFYLIRDSHNIGLFDFPHK